MANIYGFVLVLHLAIIIVDLAFNTATIILFRQHTVQLLLFILQDTSTVLGIIVMAIMFSSTFVFRAGLISFLLRRFAATIFITFFYLFTSIFLHVFSLRDRWGTERRYIWPYNITLLYTIQRIAGILYYFFYKKTILMLSDPKFHYDSEWLREKIRHRS